MLNRVSFVTLFWNPVTHTSMCEACNYNVAEVYCRIIIMKSSYGLDWKKDGYIYSFCPVVLMVWVVDIIDIIAHNTM